MGDGGLLPAGLVFIVICRFVVAWALPFGLPLGRFVGVRGVC